MKLIRDTLGRVEIVGEVSYAPLTAATTYGPPQMIRKKEIDERNIYAYQRPYLTDCKRSPESDARRKQASDLHYSLNEEKQKIIYDAVAIDVQKRMPKSTITEFNFDEVTSTPAGQSWSAGVMWKDDGGRHWFANYQISDTRAGFVAKPKSRPEPAFGRLGR